MGCMMYIKKKMFFSDEPFTEEFRVNQHNLAIFRHGKPWEFDQHLATISHLQMARKLIRGLSGKEAGTM